MSNEFYSEHYEPIAAIVQANDYDYEDQGEGKPKRIVNRAMTSARLNNVLRDLAGWLVENPESTFKIIFAESVDMSPDAELRRKFTHAYVRNTMNRVDAVRNSGRVKISNCVDDRDRKGYEISFLPGEFVKSYTPNQQKIKKEIEAASREGMKQGMTIVKQFNPDLSFLSDESKGPLSAALEIIAQYRSFAESNIEVQS